MRSHLQIWGQAFSCPAATDSPVHPMSQPSALSEDTQYLGSMDAQYFQTAQMKLHAREQRLQVSDLFPEEVTLLSLGR